MMVLKFKERSRARFYAIQAMYQRSIAKTLIKDLKIQFYEDNFLRHSVEWSFFYRLLDGIYENEKNIDVKIEEYAMNKLKSINLINLSMLRLGGYELIHCMEIPYQVILNEYVNHAKNLGAEESYGFINGLLDSLAKEFRKSYRYCKI